MGCWRLVAGKARTDSGRYLPRPGQDLVLVKGRQATLAHNHLALNDDGRHIPLGHRVGQVGLDIIEGHQVGLL
jgi:hypothetical protein